jgi:hypothetical protein
MWWWATKPAPMADLLGSYVVFSQLAIHRAGMLGWGRRGSTQLSGSHLGGVPRYMRRRSTQLINSLKTQFPHLSV